MPGWVRGNSGAWEGKREDLRSLLSILARKEIQRSQTRGPRGPHWGSASVNPSPWQTVLQKPLMRLSTPSMPHELKIRIWNACELLDMQMLTSVWNETHYHFNVCRIGVQGFDSQQGWEFFLQHRVQNGSGAHSASYPMGTRGPFPGDIAAGAWSWPLTSI
jgi:hypothetical protein